MCVALGVVSNVYSADHAAVPHIVSTSQSLKSANVDAAMYQCEQHGYCSAAVKGSLSNLFEALWISVLGLPRSSQIMFALSLVFPAHADTANRHACTDGLRSNAVFPGLAAQKAVKPQ